MFKVARLLNGTDLACWRYSNTYRLASCLKTLDLSHSTLWPLSVPPELRCWTTALGSTGAVVKMHIPGPNPHEADSLYPGTCILTSSTADLHTTPLNAGAREGWGRPSRAHSGDDSVYRKVSFHSTPVQ